MVNGSGIWTYSLYLFDSAFILVSSASWQGVPVSAFMNFLMRFLVTDTLRDNYRIGFLIGFIFYELQFVIIFFRLKNAALLNLFVAIKAVVRAATTSARSCSIPGLHS